MICGLSRAWVPVHCEREGTTPVPHRPSASNVWTRTVPSEEWTLVRYGFAKLTNASRTACKSESDA